jgi:hypothetical protein
MLRFVKSRKKLHAIVGYWKNLDKNSNCLWWTCVRQGTLTLLSEEARQTLWKPAQVTRHHAGHKSRMTTGGRLMQ